MNAKQIVHALVLGCAWLGPMHAASAQLDFLKSLPGQGSSNAPMGSLASSNFGNMAGLLQYCATNNYLSSSDADGVKDKMLAKLRAENTAPTAQPVTQSPEYLNGVNGMLSSSDGRQVNLGDPGIKETVAKKVCDTVLGQAKSFL
jgi:hypothetical protein